MLVQARVGKHDQAIQAAQQIQAYTPSHPGLLVSAARGYALSIPDASRSVTSKQANGEQVKDKAVAALPQAIAAG